MACKKSELVSAINSYTNARLTNDGNLVNYSSQLLQQMIDSLEYEPEEEPKEAAEATE